MRSMAINLASVILVAWSHPAMASDVIRSVIAEVDPVAPASSFYEQSQNNVTTSKWGVGADFNMGARFSTGPEFWTGSFLVKGADGTPSSIRREDFYPGERQKIDAIRFRWNLTAWEQAQSMRGWYMKMSYSYTKINSRANRYTESIDTQSLTATKVDSPMDETDIITDTRHGVGIGAGSRWFLYERVTASIGASLTQNFRRSVDVDSKDAQAQADYEDLINHSLPDTKMTVRPTPEVNVALGYAF